VVGAYCNLAIDLTVETALPTTGYFVVMFPKWNSGTQNVGAATSMIEYSASDLQSNGRYSINCASSAHPNLVCQFQPVTPSSVSSISTTYDELYISGFSATITSGLALNLTSSRFRNPASTKPLTNITSASYDSGGYLIDQQQVVSSYQVTAAASVASTLVAVEAVTNAQINQESAYNIILTTPLPLPVGTVM